MNKIESKSSVSELEIELGEIEKEKKKLENEIKINKLIDERFDKFKVDLLTDTKPLYDLRKDRNLEIEKMDGWKLRIKSYGESCELDLQTGKIYYVKGGELKEVRSDVEGFLDISDEDFRLRSSDMYMAFGKMNIINRAISMANITDRKDFSIMRKNQGAVLVVDGKDIITFKGIKKWFGKDVAHEAILDMLNKIVLL